MNYAGSVYAVLFDLDLITMSHRFPVAMLS